MIGPTSTFYDPDAIARSPGESQSQYQQWIDDAYGQQHHQHHPHHQQSMHQHSTHHHASYQQQQQPQAFLQGVPHSTHVPNQYGYAENQYSQHSQYVDSALGTTSTQSGVGDSTAPPDDSTSYHLQTTRGPYVNYFSHSNPAMGPASYTATPEPLYQQQQIPSHSNLGHGIENVRSHSQSQPQNSSHSYISIQTPSFSSESLGSHSQPRSSHSSSLSPASKSWTEEVYPNHGISTTNIAQTADFPAEPNTSTDISPKMLGPSSSKPIGGKLRRSAHSQGRMTATDVSSPDTTPKATAKRKRPNPGAAPPLKLYRLEESGSGGSEEDEEVDNPFNSGGISVGMGGLGVIGGGPRPRL
ncbi:hypothetical protein C0995_000995 [Termitomyces sp. Mi166|nr:hypothetical protein C0995_000995 [Termitomyces sp. Mi166\